MSLVAVAEVMSVGDLELESFPTGMIPRFGGGGIKGGFVGARHGLRGAKPALIMTREVASKRIAVRIGVFTFVPSDRALAKGGKRGGGFGGFGAELEA